MPFGITVQELSEPTILPNPASINRVYLLGGKIKDWNFITEIKSDLNILKNVRMSSYLKACIKAFFLNCPSGKLSYVCEDDPGVGNPDDNQPVASANATEIENVLKKLEKRLDLDLGYLLIPDMFLLNDSGNFTNIFSRSNNVCDKLHWINLINSSQKITDSTKAIAEREKLFSPFGHSAYYFGSVNVKQENEIIEIPLNIYAAAIALHRSSKETPYSPPAGSKYPLKGIESVNNYVNDESEFITLRESHINVLQYVHSIGYCLWGARTLATDVKFSQINTRMSIAIITKRLEIALQPLLLDSLDPQGYHKREVLRTIISVLNTAYREGALNGNTEEQAYRLEEVLLEDTPSLREILINVYARFVGTLEVIKVTFIAVSELPKNDFRF